MALSASSYFYRFSIIGSLVSGILGGIFLLSDYYPLAFGNGDIFFISTIIFFIISLSIFSWKSWKFSVRDSNFSSIRTGFKMSIRWMIILDLFIIATYFARYLRTDGQCTGIMDWDGPSHCSIWEYSFQDFYALMLLMLVGILILLPVIFSIIGFTLDKRRGKSSYPWFTQIIVFGIVTFLIWTLTLFMFNF